MLLLHPVASVSLTVWTIHASTVIGLLALGGVYAWRARTGGVEARPTRGQVAMFVGGLVAIFVSLNGPLHDLSDSFLFSAHMLQHLILTLVVPPLLLAGTPGQMLRPALRVRAIAAVARRITTPVACFVIFNVTLAAWHLPPLYNAAVEYHPVHIVQHLMFMTAAVLMWWPILSPLPELPRLPYIGQMLYTILLTLPMSVISAYIVYADRVLYPAYATAPRLWGLSPIDDQRLGGLIMWIPGALFFVGVLTVIFFRWAAEEERSELAAAR